MSVVVIILIDKINITVDGRPVPDIEGWSDDNDHTQ